MSNRVRWITAAAVLAGGVALSPGALAQTPSPAREPPPENFLTRLQAGPGEQALPRLPRYGPSSNLWPKRTQGDGLSAFWVARDTADETLGATLEPVPGPLRAQLDIPAGKGVIVAAIEPEGAAWRAGLHVNDVLLTLDGKPLASADDLTRVLKAVGEHDVALELIREGVARTIQVRPVYRVTLGPVEAEKSEYFLGISVGAPDEALRAQLRLKDRPALVVSEVLADSPAAKAGVRPNDVLLKLDDTPLGEPQELAKQVNALKGKACKLTLLRAGKETSVSATAERRTIKAAPSREAVRLWRFPQSVTPARTFQNMPLYQSVPDGAAGRVETLEKEIKDLKSSLDEIRDLLKAGAKKPDGQ